MTMSPTPVPRIRRALDLPALLERKSHFLFGPRQTGKTTLIRETLPHARVYDLLDSAVYLSLARNPGGSRRS
jgi:predicted AAA+ superfamily ATPase